MAATVPCVPSCCAEATVVEVPGVAGAVGPTGPEGPAGAAGEPAEIDEVEVFGSGSVYSLTTTPALVNLGTTTPAVQLGDAGTYLIFARARFDLNGATFAAVRTLTALIRNITAGADVTNSSAAQKVPIVTTLTFTLPLYFKVFTYESSVDNELLQLWASISVLPSAGTVDCAEADIVAIKIA